MIHYTFQKEVSYLPGDVLRPDDARRSHCVQRQQIPPASALTNGQGHEIVYHASSKYPVTCSAQDAESQASHNSDRHGCRSVFEVGNAAVVKEIKDADTGKGPRHDVCKDGARGFGIHRRELGEDIVQLAQAVDDDEDVGDFELRGIPEYHPRCIDISQRSRAKVGGGRGR